MKKVQKFHRKSAIFAAADLILPWLNPQELASVSATCKTLNEICKSVTAARSTDASRSFENLSIPFVNAVDSHPYAYFVYTHRQLRFPASTTQFDRQFWGSKPSVPLSPPNHCPPCWTLAESCGCDCGDKCDTEVSSHCPCSALESGEVITECGPSCKCGPECGSRRTQKGVSVALKVVRVKDKGWGLFAAQFIPSGQFVCEYAGELLTTKEARKRQQDYDELSRSANGLFASALLVVRENLPSGKACFRINIDATRIGNVARFINHSCDGGNLSTVIVRSSGDLLPRVCFFTARDVNMYEELSFSYGGIRQRPEGLRCLCGSSVCFGVLPSENT